MTESLLSSGFCREVLGTTFSATEYEAFKSKWGAVRLQIVDVQRYPPIPRKGERSRFYLAASDGETLVWVVIPPRTALEQDIAQFQLDIGCVVTLQEYLLLQAENGHAVVVTRHVSYSPHSRPLLGSPTWDPTLVSLSSAALLHGPSAATPTAEERETAATEEALQRFPSVTVKDIVHQPSCVLHEWKIDLQWIWIGTPYASFGEENASFPVHSDRTQARPAEYTAMGEEREAEVEREKKKTGSSEGKERTRLRDRGRTSYTVKTIGMDENGHLVPCIFYGRWEWMQTHLLVESLPTNPHFPFSVMLPSSSSSLLPPLRCWCAKGRVVWESTAEAALPSHLVFREPTALLMALGRDHHHLAVPQTRSSHHTGESMENEMTSTDQALSTRHRLAAPPFPVTPVAVVGELTRTLPSVVSILQEATLGQVVSFTARVVSVREGVLTHTIRGSTLRAHLIAADSVQRLVLLNITLWGDAAKDAAIFQRGQKYWFHRLTVREFQHQKNVSSRSDSVFIPLAETLVWEERNTMREGGPSQSEGLTREEGQPHDIEKNPMTSSGTGRASGMVGNGDVSSAPFVMSLSLSSPFLPSLARVQGMTKPLIWWQCNACGAYGALLPPSALQPPCVRCGGAFGMPVFHTTVQLSDGAMVVEAACETTAAEMLLETTASEVQAGRGSRFSSSTTPSAKHDPLTLWEDQICVSLVGCPVLVWLLRREHSDNSYLLTRCLHVDFQACSHALLSLIEKEDGAPH